MNFKRQWWKSSQKRSQHCIRSHQWVKKEGSLHKPLCDYQDVMVRNSQKAIPSCVGSHQWVKREWSVKRQQWETLALDLISGKESSYECLEAMVRNSKRKDSPYIGSHEWVKVFKKGHQRPSCEGSRGISEKLWKRESTLHWTSWEG